MITLPKLTEYDPAIASSEGTLDPLGMGSIADRMGVKLVPGFRERMRRPRFLTAIAVGAHICRYFDKEIVAADEVSEPWQVYEWYVAQALVKQFRGTKEISGLPGSEKTTNAWKSGVPLSAQRYLKTPSVFGFHGVYKTLCQEIDLAKDGVLGEAGDELLRTWEEEQDLTGFYMDGTGKGRDFRERLVSAVKEGLSKGAVAREWSWAYFTNIAMALSLNGAGPKEKEVLYAIVSGDSQKNRNQVISCFNEFIPTKQGIVWFEKDFHDFILKSQCSSLHSLVTAICLYEQFCRLLMDAFEDILFFLSQRHNKTSLVELSSLPSVRKALQKVPVLYNEVYAALSCCNESIAFELTFHDFQFIEDAQDFAYKLMVHHVNTQANKPPLGKQPWIETFEDGKYMVRPMYQREKGSDPAILYVHAYRTYSIYSFMKDIKGLV